MNLSIRVAHVALHPSPEESVDLKNLLRTSALFREASDTSLEMVISKLEQKTYQHGEKILEQGASQTTVIVIKKGHVTRTRTDAVGKVHVVEYGHPGSVYGALHALREEPSFGSLVCEEETTVYVLQAADLRQLLLSNPRFAEEALFGLSREVRAASKSLRTPLLEQSAQKLPIFATTIAASVESFYRSYMSSLMLELLNGKKTPRFPIMHIQIPTRVVYINGFKGLRYYLDRNVHPDSFANPQAAKILLAITPGLIMTPISSFLEASNAGVHNPEPLQRRMFRGIVPRAVREVIFGVGLNQLSDYFEERVPEAWVTDAVYRSMAGSAIAAVVSGYLSHFPHNLSFMKMSNPAMTYSQIWDQLGKNSIPRLPTFLQNRGALTTWAAKISTIVAPATLSVRTGQLIGSFAILNGIITFINTQDKKSA